MAKRIIIVVVILIAASVFILRSCLSKFDERSAIGSSHTASQFLVFENENQAVVFSLVKYEKAVSYKREGGFTQKNVTNTYYVQINDLYTAAKKAVQKIKSHKQIKAYPVEIIGAAGNRAWIFAGELMAYDPFTVTPVADAAIFEEKNPSLKGKLINERRYYTLDNATRQMIITAADGIKYKLNTTTLIASPIDESTILTGESRVKQLDKAISELRQQKVMAHDRLKESKRRYAQKQLSISNYKDSSTTIENETKLLDTQIDSLKSILKQAKEDERTQDELNQLKEKANSISGNYIGMKVNCDTMNGRWYGLMTNEELNNIPDRFAYRSINEEGSRNKLFTTDIALQQNNWILGQQKTITGSAVYLQGGFLINKATGTPFRLQNDFIIVYKDRIGKEGLIQLARITTSGQQLWSINTGLRSFSDWHLQSNFLVVTGSDNEALGAGEINLLQTINLATGTVAVYDFFTDKVRVAK